MNEVPKLDSKKKSYYTPIIEIGRLGMRKVIWIVTTPPKSFIRAIQRIWSWLFGKKQPSSHHFKRVQYPRRTVSCPDLRHQFITLHSAPPTIPVEVTTSTPPPAVEENPSRATPPTIPVEVATSTPPPAVEENPSYSAPPTIPVEVETSTPTPSVEDTPPPPKNVTLYRHPSTDFGSETVWQYLEKIDGKAKQLKSTCIVDDFVLVENEDYEHLLSSGHFERIVDCGAESGSDSDEGVVSPSFFSWVLSPIVGVVNAGLQTTKNLLINGNHPWKQHKYQHTNRQLRTIINKKIGNLQENEMNTPLEQKLLELQKILGDATTDYRNQHKAFLMALRNALYCAEADEAYQAILEDREHPDGESVRVLYRIAAAIYKDVELFSFMNSVLNLYTSHELDQKGPEEITHDIKGKGSDYGAERITVLKNNAKGAYGKNFDPHMLGNIPSKMMTLTLTGPNSEERATKIHRQGTPTIGWRDETNGLNTMIAPEYVGFLRHCKLEGKKVLYVSLQDPTKGADKDRTDAIKNLINHEEFKDVATFVTLDQDSPFYKQEGTTTQNANQFMEEFLEQMFDRPEGSQFYFPDHLRTETVRNNTRKIMELVHKMYFNENENLTVDQKRAFIELFYSPFILYLNNMSKADYNNITCKDDLDRGGKCKSLLMLFIARVTGQIEDKTNFDRMWKTLIFTPTILVKKQAMHGARFKRMMNTIKESHLFNMEKCPADHEAWDLIGIRPNSEKKRPIRVNQYDYQAITYTV